MAFSPDGTKSPPASDDKTARLWDAATGQPLGSPMEHDDRVLAVAFSPDGTKLAAASWDRIGLWAVPRSLPDDQHWRYCLRGRHFLHGRRMLMRRSIRSPCGRRTTHGARC